MDIEAILAELEPGQRDRLEAMLGQYSAGAGSADWERRQPSRSDGFRGGDGLSPWLQERLEAAPGPAAPADELRVRTPAAGGVRLAAMTPTAQATLAACVAETPAPRHIPTDSLAPLPSFLGTLLGVGGATPRRSAK